MRRLFAAALVLAVALTLAAPAARGGEQNNAAVLSAVMPGAALLRSGQNAAALEHFARLAEQFPDNDMVLLWQARAALAVGDNDLARRNFDLLLERNPEHPILRREAYEAFRGMGDHTRVAAMPLADPRSVEQMVKDSVGTELIASVARARMAPPTAPRPATASGERPRSRVFGRISAGILYDSNPNNGPGSEMLRLGDFLVRVEGMKRVPTMAAYLGAYVGFEHRLSPHGDWSLVGDLNLFVRGNARSRLDDLESREWQSGRATAGFAYMSGRNLLDMRLKFEVFDYELKNRAFSTGPELAYLHAATPNLHLITRAGLEWRDYYRSSYRDGVYGNVGQYFRVFFGCDPERRHSVTFGGRYYGSGADAVNQRYHAWDASLRLELKATSRFSVMPHVSYGREYYRGPGTVFDKAKRRDKSLRAGLDLNYDVNEHWSVNASYSYRRNKSNSAFNDYNQHVVGAGMGWKF